MNERGAAPLFSVEHSATGNSDRQGRVVEDQTALSVKAQSQPDVASPFGSPDQYGGVLSDPRPAYRETSAAPGIGDSYGSIVHEVGLSY